MQIKERKLHYIACGKIPVVNRVNRLKYISRIQLLNFTFPAILAFRIAYLLQASVFWPDLGGRALQCKGEKELLLRDSFHRFFRIYLLAIFIIFLATFMKKKVKFIPHVILRRFLHATSNHLDLALGAVQENLSPW